MLTVAKASARDQRVSPKKARLVVDLIRGKELSKAIDEVTFLNKKTSKIVLHLLNSAFDAASKKGFSKDELVVCEAICQEGRKLKRMFIRARGRSTRYYKRMSHIKIALAKIEPIAQEETAKKTKADKAGK